MTVVDTQPSIPDPWLSVSLDEEIDGVMVSISVEVRARAFSHEPEALQRLCTDSHSASEARQEETERILKALRPLLARARDAGRASLGRLACDYLEFHVAALKANTGAGKGRSRAGGKR